MRLASDYLHQSTGNDAPSKRVKTADSNGFSNHSDDDLEQEMDIDEPQVSSVWKPVPSGVDEMGNDREATRTDSARRKYTDQLNEAVTYGRELKQQFKEDQSQLVSRTMSEIFGMFIHEDPRNSEHAHLLEASERNPVAEAVNSAVLGKC